MGISIETGEISVTVFFFYQRVIFVMINVVEMSTLVYPIKGFWGLSHPSYTLRYGHFDGLFRWCYNYGILQVPLILQACQIKVRSVCVVGKSEVNDVVTCQSRVDFE